jgi:hypothetical protein
MGRLICSMSVSPDGFVSDRAGLLDWVHAAVRDHRVTGRRRPIAVPEAGP